MPKRTNDFQTLIATIYDQIVPEGGSVTESGMVLDKEAGILREVDILVEYKYAGHNFCFVVECRDRSRSETVEWIDGLIGKTKSLKVNKVIAVSSKGFTASAERKAKENGIDILTLKEANETDWASFPIKPGLILMTDDVYNIHEVFYKLDDGFIPITTLDLESNVEIKGEIVGDLKGLIEYIFKEHLVPQIDKYKKEHFLEIFKSKSDAEKSIIVEREYDWSDIYILSKEGDRIQPKKVKYVVVGSRKTVDVKQQHRVFNEKMVSTGKHLDSDGMAIEFSIIQDPDTNKIHGRWNKVKTESNA